MVLENLKIGTPCWMPDSDSENRHSYSRRNEMKRVWMVMVLVMLTMSAGTLFAEDAPQALIDYVHATLVQLGADPVIVAAVKAENATGKTLQQIKDLDDQWKATAGVADYMDAMMTSPCGTYLREIQADSGFYSEIFVMDNQGANVAMTDKTSDYWQGDEDKFLNSFDDGRGDVFIDEVEFDNSTQSYLVQASIPVTDGAEVIGAITVGIDIDEFEAQL